MKSAQERLEEIVRLEAEVERLRTALVAVQWGSCDGCGQHEYCPVCHARSRKDNPADGPPWDLPNDHAADCIVGIALIGGPS